MSFFVCVRNKWLVGGVLCFVFLIGVVFGLSLGETRTSGIVLCPDGFSISVLIADEHHEQVQGLSGTSVLEENEGVLFLYKEAGYPVHWMKDMFISIDLLWLLDGEIVFMVENAPIPSGGEIAHYRPEALANQVLEVPAGFVQKHGLSVGDHLDVHIP
ncbi:MAG: hypothetical protein UX57_C0001G0005 [Candidatus Uhrbacteria bacterium GW2011_GWE2_46_68]|uniref:DUF192 domain-containing protein n=2 Tax=Candidatus Uhriibacteriota TaxID=1752732 RepID=A0A0G1Q9Q1_9BACT|nr:MAG: hypothetical protein UX45_C0002G0005 [Candidatus Uhrbacteria bacterium GW2011_GWF2_46_218]KKU41781.1 MAG: hypothetical protein UX57_C0001G0005 [Candidatus Uhrbacteria bacterium GW2011_GWE2_46_68]